MTPVATSPGEGISQCRCEKLGCQREQHCLLQPIRDSFHQEGFIGDTALLGCPETLGLSVSGARVSQYSPLGFQQAGLWDLSRLETRALPGHLTLLGLCEFRRI